MSHNWIPSKGDKLITKNETWEVTESDEECKMVQFDRDGRDPLRISWRSAREKLTFGGFELVRGGA